MLKKNFSLHQVSKNYKGKSEPKPEECIAERTILRKGMVAEIKKEEESMAINCLKTALLIIKAQVTYT